MGTQQKVGIGALLDELRPDTRIYLPGASGEILALAQALAKVPERAAGLHLTGCFVPGINETLDYAGLTPTTRLTTFMLPSVMKGGFAARQIALLPLTYLGAARFLSEESFDVALAHVAAPDRHGRCSLGIASDFAPIAWARARRRVLVVNPSMPRLPGALSLPVSEADAVITLDSSPIESADRAPDGTAQAIAHRIAGLVPDGAHIQAGIGGAPGAVWNALTAHRGLVLRSGLVTPGFRTLAHADALDPDGAHVAGIALGDSAFYDWLAETDLVRFGTTFETHGLVELARCPRLTSINGALEVDLFGQVNVEWQGARIGGGVGGGPDFMRAAALSDGGRSIIALPATARGGSLSRIVARLDRPSASIARSDVDTIVTEHGVAELRGKDLDSRAEALTALAEPRLRDAIWADWEAIRRAMT